MDTGLTISTVGAQIRAWGAASVVCVTLLDKQERRKLPYKPDYVGFQVGGGRAGGWATLALHGKHFSPLPCAVDSK